jgi:hypothetical protein
MAIGAVLVDRARVIERLAAGVKVEGTTMTATSSSAWFRARLFLEGSPERREQGERKKVVATPQLMFAMKDENGELISGLDDSFPTAVLAKSKVEVNSAQLGRSVWFVTGDPQPIRKKRSVIGWLANLERVVERPVKGVV